MDTARFCESQHVGHERVSTIVVHRGDTQTSAVAQGAEMACALLKAALVRREQTEPNRTNEIPMTGGDEMTLVQPEGVPTVNRDVVSVDAGISVGRASGALMTGPTPQGGRRQTPQGESSDCQGQPIAAPADGNTIGGAHDALGAAPDGDPYRGCPPYEEHGACVCSTGYPASCQRDECRAGGPCYFERIDPRDEKQLGMSGPRCVECGRAPREAEQ